MSQPKAPKAPNPNKLYAGGIKTYLQYQPQLLSAEQDARNLYDPQRVQQQLDLQQNYGPTQYSQQLSALKQLDPTGTALRDQLGGKISSDLALGTKLSPDMETQLESEIRGAESARGNVIGNAPATAEELFKGQAALNLYQQRLQNAGNFLNSPTPEQQLVTVSPITADRSSAYTNPNAGYQAQQFGLQNYSNQLAQFQLSGGSRNPWAGALSGAASGAAAGSVAGPYGAIGGALIGGAGGYFSSMLVKTDVSLLGMSKSGLPIISFRYIWDLTRKFVGTSAEEVQKIMPDAVSIRDGLLVINYDIIDVPFFEITE